MRIGVSSLARLLGVPLRMVRSWEEEFPLLVPPKGMSGRKLYGLRELAFFDRLAWLRRERGLALSPAKEEILRSRTDPGSAATRAALDESRADFLRLWARLESLRLKSEVAAAAAIRLGAALSSLRGLAPAPVAKEETADPQLELPW